MTFSDYWATWDDFCKLENGVEIRDERDESSISDTSTYLHLYVNNNLIWVDDNYNHHPIEDLTLYRDLSDLVYQIKVAARERDEWKERALKAEALIQTL